MNSSLTRFIFHIKKLFKTYLLGLGIFFLARLFLYYRLETGMLFSSFLTDIFKAFWIGARFDTMVLLYGMVLPFVLAFIGLFLPSKLFHKAIDSFSRFYLLVLLTLYIFLLIIDVYYYDYFQSHINILFFGFFEDDTNAVMKSVWTDYPLIRVLLVFALLVFVLFWFLKRIYVAPQRPEYTMPAWKGTLFSLFSIAFLLVGMRGSFGTFPLQIDDATISENAAVNLLPMNGVFALKEAWITRKKQMNMDGNIEWIKALGYNSAQQAISDFYGVQPTSSDPGSLQEYYFSKVPLKDSLKGSHPHVVFFMMESMSNYNMGFHSRDLNLLGSLEKYWESEIVFRKCLPFGNGTINSLEGLMVNTPVTSLAQSSNRYINFGSSIAIPFKNAGYQTTYVTGGKLGWRNINEFIPNQHFDRVQGNANIHQRIPETRECEWGVYDEYLFDYVFNLLEESNGQPQMIFAMSTTNHTPFNLPPDYKAYPVNIPQDMKGRLQTEEKMAEKNFTNLQYSNDCLGRFLNKLKASPYAENTIVAATGDHNNLMLFSFSDEQIIEKRGVPLFMYIPEKIKRTCRIDTSLFVAHKDIFPTLMHLALSDQKYFNGGSFLFDASIPKATYFSIDLMSKEAVSEAGAVQFDPDPSFYLWNENKQVLSKTTAPTAALDSLLKKSRSYYSAMSYFIKNEIELHKK